jgi:hypothetical protein
MNAASRGDSGISIDAHPEIRTKQNSEEENTVMGKRVSSACVLSFEDSRGLGTFP